MEIDADEAVGIAAGICRRFESCRLTAYHCAADRPGLLSIGWGSTSCAGGPVEPGQTITQDQADAMLAGALPDIRRAVAGAVTADLTPWQEGALISFAYNAGCGAFRSSRLLRCVNAGDLDAAAAEFACWDHADGRVAEGLARRRAFERSVFLGECLP